MAVTLVFVRLRLKVPAVLSPLIFQHAVRREVVDVHSNGTPIIDTAAHSPSLSQTSRHPWKVGVAVGEVTFSTFMPSTVHEVAGAPHCTVSW